jgi:hypothetical protein
MVAALRSQRERLDDFSISFNRCGDQWLCEVGLYYRQSGSTPEEALERMHSYLRALSEEKLEELQKALS